MEDNVAVPSAPVVNYAGVGRRWVASFVDALILMVPNIIISVIFSVLAIAVSGQNLETVSEGTNVVASMISGVGSLIGMALAFAYYIYFIGKSGQTLGKRALRVKVVRVDGIEPVGYMNAFLREVVGKFLSGIVFALGYLWALWDPKKQTWHDKIAKTVVVKI